MQRLQHLTAAEQSAAQRQSLQREMDAEIPEME
jgi:hypothetical protein